MTGSSLGLSFYPRGAGSIQACESKGRRTEPESIDFQVYLLDRRSFTDASAELFRVSSSDPRSAPASQVGYVGKFPGENIDSVNCTSRIDFPAHVCSIWVFLHYNGPYTKMTQTLHSSIDGSPSRVSQTSKILRKERLHIKRRATTLDTHQSQLIPRGRKAK